MRTWEEVRQESLKNDAEESAAYLRAAIEENDARFLFQAVSNVFAARGTLKGLGLTKTELVTLTDAVLTGLPASRKPKPARKTAVARVLA